MKLAQKTIKRIWWMIPLFIGASTAIAALFFFDTAHSPIVIFSEPKQKVESKITKKPNIEAEEKKTAAPAFNKNLYSTTDPLSLWIIVNKQHPLNPIDYSPNDLINSVGAIISDKARPDFEAMNNDALAAGINFTIVSSYRSYATQSAIYNNYVATYGQSMTDTFSARPGYSEHQTGLTIDFGSSTGSTCNLGDCFGSTIEGQWLATNAYKYGFIMRYPAEKQIITGYKAESWHFRYVGRELATEIYKIPNMTMEEYFNVSGGEVYI